ncbi:MAG: PepSY domain-containing protein [Myxococcales bacterium]|nr:PepSY domain-containing protein [Myxococcales bacterium]
MSGARRRYFRWHQATGLCVAAFVLVIAVTGVLLSFRDQLGKSPPPRVEPVETKVALEVIVQAAVDAGDGSRATDLALPGKPDAPYVVWLDDDDESVVYLDGAGRVVEVRSTKGGLTRVLFKLHTGEIIGLPGELLSVATGLGLCVLTYTGVAMILSRRRRRAA